MTEMIKMMMAGSLCSRCHPPLPVLAASAVPAAPVVQARHRTATGQQRTKWVSRRVGRIVLEQGYALGADATEYPRHLVTHHLRGQPWGHPGARPTGGIGCVNADWQCVDNPPLPLTRHGDISGSTDPQ